MSTSHYAVPALHKVLQPVSRRTHQQTAIVRTVIDELERCAPSPALAREVEAQLIDELRRLARRVLEMADTLEEKIDRETMEPMAQSGVQLRSSI